MLNSTSVSSTRYTRFFIILTIAFALMIVGIIALADSGSDMWLFQLDALIPYGDKVAHFSLVGGLTFLLNLALSARQVTLAKRHWLLGSVLIFVIFTVEEFTQIGIASRTFDLGDLSADYVGILFFGRMAKAMVGWLAS